MWWTVGDSNPRLPRCERGALPAELTARLDLYEDTYYNATFFISTSTFVKAFLVNLLKKKVANHFIS